MKKINYFFIKVYIFIAVGYNDFFEEFSMNTQYSSVNFHYFHIVVIKIATDLCPCISVSIKHEIKSVLSQASNSNICKSIVSLMTLVNSSTIYQASN